MLCIGLMSGTSMDGIDVAELETDGESITQFGPSATFPYSDGEKTVLRNALGKTDDVEAAEEAVTLAHLRAVRGFASRFNIDLKDIRVIGFHGHTTFHDPENGITRQIGNGAELASQLGVDVVCDFRSNDVSQGGQGAPFAPVYHRALASNLEPPLAVLNIGGVANVTWINGPDILAFDTGPGNALLDDWCRTHFDKDYDRDGEFSGQGQCSEKVLKDLLDHPYFEKAAPKSLDREDFNQHVKERIGELSPVDGAATLCAFTARSVALALEAFPTKPKRWLVCGGGRKNSAMMAALTQQLNVSVEPVEVVGWDGDALEAQAFAFLAARSLLGLPLSFPGTTGVQTPLTGGELFKGL